jgi:hypothetical protein
MDGCGFAGWMVDFALVFGSVVLEKIMANNGGNQ